MSKYLIGNRNSVPYISNCYPPSKTQLGQVWYDSGIQSLVVYDGNSWVPFAMPDPVMTLAAEEAIDRMIDMIKNQSSIADMADKYPLVKDALGQLEVALKMCQNLEDNE